MSLLTSTLERLLLDGVELSIADGKLRVRAPQGRVTPDALDLLRRSKDEILRVLPGHRFRAPLSIGQEGLWFIQRSDPGNIAYNVGCVLRIESARDPAPALRRALQALINRHALLRTTIGADGDGPVQTVQAFRVAELPEADAARSTAVEREAAVSAILHRPFDLEREGVLRPFLLRCGERESLLVLCVHHIAVDTWSFGLLLDELFQLLAAGDGPNPLPPLERTYQHYVAWQRQAVAARRQELRRFWLNELAGAPQVLELPLDHPRPPVQTYRGRAERFALDAGLVQRLRAVCQGRSATLSMLLLSAFQVLLHRHTGQDDFCVGLASAGRDHGEFSAVFGYMVNLLVLRTQLAGDAPPPFAQLLAQTRDRVADALDHQDYPFQWLVSDLLGSRDLSRAPLVQAGFAYQRLQLLGEATARIFGGGDAEVAGLRIARVPLDPISSEFDLILEVTESVVGVRLAFRYNADLFEPATIAQMAEHLQRLLAGIAADPDQPIAALPMLGPAEREQLVVDWNRTAAPFSATACLHHLFALHAERDAVALVDLCGATPRSLRYPELARRSHQLAHRLQRLGVGPEVRVGVCLERGAELIVALLGVLMAGGAFVVLDPEHPPRRLAALLEDTAVPVLVTSGSLLALLPATGARVVDCDLGFSDEPAHQPHSSARPDHLAYLLYTSGTTGQPNGVLIEHRGLVNSIEAHIDLMQAGPGALHAHLLSFNFDGAIAHLFTMLCAGGTTYLAPRDGGFLGGGLLDLLRRQEITHALIPPSMLAALPDADLPALQTLVVAGERCSADLVRRWGRGRRMINMYGPTEVSILATAAPCLDDGRDPPIGRPIANTRAYVVDRWGELAPAGASGELWLGGVGVARGYWNRPELTARKFRDDPFAEGRVYRTGDRVRYRRVAGGPPVLEFLGRADGQVKLRGYRVELAEVEQALRALPGVRAAVATVHEGARLLAYVTPADLERSPALELEQVAAWDAVSAGRSGSAAGGGPEAGPAAHDPTLDLRGWKSSFTGEDIPVEEMRAWAEATVERIAALGPRDVLEIGCGTGLLLTRLAGRVRSYRGTDLTLQAIAHIESLKARSPELAQVRVTQQPAHDLQGLGDQRYDTILLNSVVQYFPSAEYLFAVIEGLLGLMQPAGAIFIGDVRHLALLETYHAAVELHRAGPAVSRRELAGRLQGALVRENELVIHPGFFLALRAAFPQITDVEIAPKRGRFRNELALFRYDVTLRIGAAQAPAQPVDWQEAGTDGISARDVRAWIARSDGRRALGLRGLRNARLLRENALRAWLHGDEDRHPTAPPPEDLTAWDPEDLYRLAEELPCSVQVSWAAGRADGSLDAIITTGGAPPRAPLPPAVAPGRWSELTNDPLLGRRYRDLAAELHRALRDTLPAHLVPAAITVLPRLPLTLNGKVDRQALPPPEALHEAPAEARPRTAVEHKLAAAWCSALGLPSVGIHDNFFALGGDSISSIQVVTRAQALGVALRPQQLFEHQTIAQLAASVTGAASGEDEEPSGAEAEPDLVALEPAERRALDERLGAGGKATIEAIYPLLPLQQGLLFHTLQDPTEATYGTQIVLGLEGALDVAALRRAFAHVLRCHPLLRSCFLWEGLSQPLQVVLTEATLPWHEEDLRGAADLQRALTAVGERLRALRVPIDQAPVLRVTLARTAADGHELFLDSHHILLDGWSLAILLRDVLDAYRCAIAAQPPPALAAGAYGRYLRWLQRQDRAPAVAFWRDRLRDVERPTPLGVDRRQRTAARGHRVHTAPLPADLSAALHATAEANRVTIATLLEGAWALLLARYSGQDDVVFGTVASGRDVPVRGVEHVVGFFLHTLPLRARIDEAEELGTFLRALQQRQAEARAHQHLPLSEIQRQSGIPASAPLFHSVLVFENFPVDEGMFRGAGLAVAYRSSATPTQYPLVVSATPGAPLSVSFDYDVTRFDQDSIGRMAGHLTQVLRCMVRAPAPLLGEISPLTQEEAQTLAVDWNRTAAPYSSAACIHHLFEAQADQRPDAVALVDHCGGAPVAWTYGQLERRANRLAHRLRRLGVGPDVRVGVGVPRGAELIVALLAVLKAGGAFVVLDPEHPAQRLALLLEDTGVPVLITSGPLGAAPPATTARIVDLSGGLLDEPAHRPDSGAGPEHLAYLLYTSGTTGQPSGVLIEHRGLVNSIEAHIDLMQTGPGALHAHLLSFNFDGAIAHLFTLICAGGTSHLLPRDSDFLGQGLVELLRREGITHALIPPSMLAALPDADLPALHTLVVAGERCSAQLVERWGRGRRMLNMYGPTEASILATCAPCVVDGPDGEDPPIGRPIANMQAYVVDARGRLLPPGAVGELWLGGVGIARGYLNRPELTARKFRPNPFGPGRLYCTGDLVRHRLGDADPPPLEFIGRADGQIKLRGYRIEPGEIEAALRACGQVRDAVVKVHTGTGEAAAGRLVAYVTPAAPEAAEAADVGALAAAVERRLRDTLPAHLVPSAIVVLQRLPLTLNGKVDVAALPPPGAASSARAEAVAPRNRTERALAAIWCQVLGLPSVGVHDNFFDLGGDSIVSIQVVSRAQAAGIVLRPGQLFEHQTIARLAAIAAGQRRPAEDQGTAQGPVPLTPIQRWFLTQDRRSFHHFNQAVLLETPADLDVAALRVALRHIAAHHDALRLRFTLQEGSWQQECRADAAEVPLTEVDAAALDPDGQRALLAETAARLQAGLDIGAGPLSRLAYLRCGAQRPGRLLWIVHHLVVDAVSWRILVPDLALAYRQARAGQPIALAAKTTSFQRWAERLRDHAAQAPFDEERATLALPPPSPLPVDHPGGRNDRADAAQVCVALDEALTRRLTREAPRAYNLGVQDLLLTALVQVLARWAGGRDEGDGAGPGVWIDLEGHGREELFDDVDLSRTVGWFTSLFPVRLPLPTGDPAADLIAVKEALRAVPLRGIGYGLLRYLRQDGAALRWPQPAVSFNYLGQLSGELGTEGAFRLAPEGVGPMDDAAGQRTHVLEVQAVRIDDRLSVTFGYSSALHDAATIEGLAQAFRGAVVALCDHCTAPGAGAWTPSDFPHVKLRGDELHALVAQAGAERRGDLEAIYPLVSIQPEILRETLASSCPDLYMTQIRLTFTGALDSAALRWAWEQAVRRHPLLRSFFAWQGLSAPVQVVLREVALPWHEHDWQDVPPAEQEGRLTRLGAELSRAGLPLATGPLLRLTLVRTAAERYTLFYDNHHVLTDGWSLGVILRGVFEDYLALHESRQPPPVAPGAYEDYLRWLALHDRRPAHAYWHRTLAGFLAPSPLPRERDVPGPARGHAHHTLRLPAELTARLHAAVEAARVTTACLLDGAWALLLGRGAGLRDVLFGEVVSGRDVDVPGIEGLAGHFIYSVPLRVALPEEQDVWTWLRALQAARIEAREHQHVPLAALRAYAAGTTAPLFRSLVVFENYPLDLGLLLRAGLTVQMALGAGNFTHHPLVLSAQPHGDGLELLLTYDTARFDRPAVAETASELAALLDAMTRTPAPLLAALLARTAP